MIHDRNLMPIYSGAKAVYGRWINTWYIHI